MGTQANKDLAERFHRSIYEGGDLAAADDLLTTDFVVWGSDSPAEGGRGPEYVKEDATALRAAFTIDLTHDLIVAEDDKVVIHWTLRGEHVGPLGEMAATNKKVRVSGIDIFRIAGDRLAELWQYWDQPALMQQLS
jgi:ketosteroid isomerase-like protein